MSVLLKMKNPIFNAEELYRMVRVSMIKYLPYPPERIEPHEVLTIYLQKVLELEIEVENLPENRGLIFRGRSYDMFKNMQAVEAGSEHSPAWHVVQVAKWNKSNLGDLGTDLNFMRKWLTANDYIKNELPTDKFLQQEFLIIADASAERRKGR
ncbi:hypothetical protein MTP48_17055 [Erwinia amylovora]|uniref:hypothetical protein n=1 Tax=Erwinia amylovora TaxID=552 RepID=UPI0022ABA787|nr:hypothetical protein [Erwinia amylovora]MCZ2719981.1 hypothetical protein [Erwinia amylovora]